MRPAGPPPASHTHPPSGTSTARRLSIESVRGELRTARQSLSQMRAAPRPEVTPQMIQAKEAEIGALQEVCG